MRLTVVIRQLLTPSPWQAITSKRVGKFVIHTLKLLQSGRANGTPVRLQIRFNTTAASPSSLFVDFVEGETKIAGLKGPSVDELKVCFDLDNHYKAAIDGWIEFAMKKEIRKLDLDLNEDYGALLIQREFYAFPSHLLKNFTLGKSSAVICICDWRGSRVLVISCSVSEGIMCEMFTRSGTFLCLWAGTEADVFKDNRLFSNYFMQLERLSLFLKPGNVVQAPFYLDIPELGNLKYLELKISLYTRQSLLACIPLLDASPLLQEFILKIIEHITLESSLHQIGPSGANPSFALWTSCSIT
ncbi:hypothetical protein Vadar_007688 [Vaccinium darrowii]|uniref:Uncharacterized protein n=1 Tax=Vaccinium darrowii TaxID=229202 RepID=A0ACB7XYS9_9ERIC|nr:hypothetical protein Vadar_007688 [Vaccinium darrowii]